MTVRVLRLAMAGLTGLGLVAIHGVEYHPAAAMEPTAATPVRIYRTSCLECHDSDGRGESGRDQFPGIPDFSDPRWQASRSDAELGRSILEGKGKSMPRMRRKLGSLDVSRMVAFVRGFPGGKQLVGDESDAPGSRTTRRVEPAQSLRGDRAIREGSRLFQRLCVTCHGTDGSGSEMREGLPALPDFTRPAWQKGRSDPQLVVSVLGGKGAGMPPFRSKVGRDKVGDLVAYIRAFAPSETQLAGIPSDDFEARFEQLKQEVEGLGRQFRALSAPPRQP